MSRRLDREGFTDGDVNRVLNRRHWAERERRGLKDRYWVRFDNRDGWAALGLAWWHRYYRLWVLRGLISPYERAEHFRYARLYLAEARACDRPRLP